MNLDRRVSTSNPDMVAGKVMRSRKSAANQVGTAETRPQQRMVIDLGSEKRDEQIGEIESVQLFDEIPVSFVLAIADDPYLLGRDQATLRQQHDFGDERADLLLRIDDLDHHGQILR